MRKKRWVAGLLLLTMLTAALPGVAGAATPGAAAVEVVATVSLREAPSTSGDLIRYLKAGESVTLLQVVNEYWLQVRDGSGKTGYVSSDAKYVKTATESAVAERTAIIRATVTLRTQPSTSGDKIRMLKAGETVFVTDKPNAYWYAVRDNDGKTGYVSSSDEYISMANATPTPKPTTTPTPTPTPTSKPAQVQTATIKATVALRTQPSTSGDKLRFLKAGETVVVTGQPNGYWYAVKDANGVSGYVSTSDTYIVLNRATATPTPTPSPTPSPTPTPTSTPTPTPTPTPTAPDKVEAVIAAGLQYLGTPYEYGSSRGDTSTFDCSDFVRQAFKDALGLVLPADSRQQAAYLLKNGSDVTTDWHDLKRGDIMFFMSYIGSKASLYADKQPFGETVTHTGIYLGDGQVLQTYSVASGGVRIDSIAGKHWEYRFLFGGSVL